MNAGISNVVSSSIYSLVITISSMRWNCSTSTDVVPRPSLSDTVLTQWHRANTTDYFGLCEQDC